MTDVRYVLIKVENRTSRIMDLTRKKEGRSILQVYLVTIGHLYVAVG